MIAMEDDSATGSPLSNSELIKIKNEMVTKASGCKEKDQPILKVAAKSFAGDEERDKMDQSDSEVLACKDAIWKDDDKMDAGGIAKDVDAKESPNNSVSNEIVEEDELIDVDGLADSKSEDGDVKNSSNQSSDTKDHGETQHKHKENAEEKMTFTERNAGMQKEVTEKKTEKGSEVMLNADNSKKVSPKNLPKDEKSNDEDSSKVTKGCKLPENKELLDILMPSKKVKRADDELIDEKEFVDKCTETKGGNEDTTSITEQKNEELLCQDSDKKLSEASNTSSEVSLKHLAAKYTRIGPAQLIARPVSAKPTTSTSTSSTKQATAKRTEKFIVRNVSKVSKVYKVSNLSYKIKPVRRNLAGKDTKCPVIYVGEPTFVDLDDYTTQIHDLKQSPDGAIINDEDLYDIKKLCSSFVPTDKSVSPAPKLPRQYPYRDIPHPTLNNLPRYQSHPPFNYNHSFVPRNQITYAPSGNFNTANVIRIVARTVPSATVASHVSTTTSKFKTIAPMPVSHGGTKKLETVVAQRPNVVSGGFVNTPRKERQALPVTKISSKPPMTIVMPVASSSDTKTASVMTVKFLPTSQPSSCPKGKMQVPIKVISPTMLSKIASPTTISTTKGQISSSVAFVQSKKVTTVAVTSSITAKPQVSNTPKTTTVTNLAKCNDDCHSVVNKITPIATIISRPSAISSQAGGKYKEKSDTPRCKPLREGVEVAFEDGVRHFISSLKQMTYLDDEPIKSWADLKKGTKVAARWTDGQIYDATIVGCYFSIERRLQPVVKLEKLTKESSPNTKSDASTTRRSKNIVDDQQKENSIGCTKCRAVFPAIYSFRFHQRSKCKSPGIMVPKNAKKVTDTMIAAVSKENLKQLSFESNAEIQRNKRKASSPKTTRRSGKRRKTGPPDKEGVAEESKTKEKPQVQDVFKKGTKFLHRWQLDDGSSRWYEGEIISVLFENEPLLDREFEVTYKGEDENYFLKLYEDYPSDIRIMGKT